MIIEDVLNRFNVTAEELCRRVNPKVDEVLFLSGSLFDGLGNARSDLDIFLITDDTHPLLQNERTIDQNIVVQNKRYDLSIFAHSLIQETASILNKMDFADPDIYVSRQLHPQVSNYEICTMVHRLRVGKSIFNADKFERLLKDFPFQAYISWLTRLKFNEYDGLYEDIVGSLESGDLLTAEELVQQQLKIVSQIVILSAGETFDREKWIPRKMVQMAEKGKFSDGFVNDFFMIRKSLAVGSKEEILKVISFCESQIEALQLGLI